ncbi:MAG TPA: hypothetical protein VGQ43_02345, partial [Candidatus Udaeobacter sp.]|nr:hypothetical protein [Candidatus Udaeobacter sp.]
NSSRGICNERDRLNGKIGVAEFRVIACPIFRFRKNDSAQDFAALHLRRLFFLFCRLGMEWALGLPLVDFRCDCREGAMIGDRDPCTDR